MGVLKNIIRSGVLDSDPYSKKRSIVLSNYIAIILTIAAILVFVIRSSLYSANTYALTFDFLIEAILLFLAPIVLNRFSLPTIGRLFLCLGSVLFLWHIYVIRMISMDQVESTIYDSFRIFLLALSPIPFLIFDKSKFPVLLFAMLPTFISVFFFETLLGFANINHAQHGIPGEDYALMQMRTTIAYFIICGTCYAFHVIITRNDEFNQIILDRLKLKSDEVLEQNKKLVENQDELNKLNRNLENLVEEKTANIKKQNEQLRRVAFANAHEVRGPVARLLGLLQLSKIESDLQYPWIFEKLKNEAESLDEIVKKVTEELDQFNEG